MRSEGLGFEPSEGASAGRIDEQGLVVDAGGDLVLPSLMDKLALVGTRDHLLPRVAAMAEAGIDEIVIQPVIDPPTEMTELAKLTA